MQLVVDDFLVAHRVDASVHVCHVFIVETTQHMDDSIRFTNVREEFVTQSFAFAGTLYESGNVHDFHRSGHDASRMYQFGELRQALIGHGDYTHIRFYCTKREVCRLRFCVGQTVEKRRLAYIWQTDNTTL